MDLRRDGDMDAEAVMQEAIERGLMHPRMEIEYRHAMVEHPNIPLHEIVTMTGDPPVCTRSIGALSLL